MEVRGTVISCDIDVQVAKNGGGSYPGSRLTYRDTESGQVKEKAFHNNVFKFNAGLKTQLSNLSVGDTFVMVLEKENDFWNCKGITKEGSVSNKPTNNTPATNGNKITPVASPKSTYETPEERAKKQVYIVRQSSISAALTYTSQIKDYFKGTDNPINEIINIAKQFEHYVFEDGFDDGSLMTMENDIV